MERSFPAVFTCIRCMTYNQSVYITDAMNGFCMQQTNFPFLAIVMDDASTDGEQVVIEDYIKGNFLLSDNSCLKWETEEANWLFAQHCGNSNCYFLVVFLKRNMYKQKQAKLELIKEWEDKCKYIALCEGDDYWTDPLKLQRQVDYMEEHEECVMTACASHWIRDGEFVKNDRITEEPRNLTTEEVIRGGGPYLATCSLVFNNKKLNSVIPEWRRVANVGDYPLQIQGTLAGKLWYFPECMCVYRADCKGSWTIMIYGNIENRLRHWQAEIGWMKKLNLETNEKYQRAIYEHLLPYFHVLYKLGMVSGKEYLQSVFVVGGWRNYYRMMKDFAKCLIGCIKPKTE